MALKLSIAAKFGLIGILGCVVLGATVGATSALRSQSSAEDAVKDSLLAVATARAEALDNYLETIEQDLLVVAENPNTLAALEAFSSGWDALGRDAGAQLQDSYITSNPFPTGEKDQLDMAGDGTGYSAAHGRYHPWFREMLHTRGYYDVFLFDADGQLVYTVFKELDFATDLVDGAYADSDLGAAFRAAMALEQGDAVFFDFQAYAPSHGAPASFIATPLFAPDGTRVGALAFQMPIDRLNAVMGSLNGLGETGEAYALGRDGLMRTQARFADGQSILSRSVGDALAESVFDSRSGVLHAVDHRGQHVIAAFGVVEFHGVEWGVAVTKTTAEAFAAARELTLTLVAIAAVITVLVGGAGFLVAARAAAPIRRIATTTRRIGNGELSLEVPHQGLTDEVGELARAVDVFRRSAIEKLELERAQAEAESRAVEDRRRERITMAQQFENAVGSIVTTVSSAATELAQAAEGMLANSSLTSERALNVAAAAEQATTNVETVAAATEEISASSAEIGRQAEETSAKATAGARQAAATEAQVESLASAAQRIGDVVTLIQAIAEQTNLLALNATIEAARAGEAGRGFAIVAQEVKQLASQTAAATTDIAEQIQAIQDASGASAHAMAAVSGTVNELSQIATSIAGAVEEQTAAMHEVAANVSEAAAGTRGVSSNIGEVTERAGESSASASQVLAAAQELSRQSEMLRTEVDRFLEGVRAA